ncbi:MAG: amino acid racemase [bacterium]|nr:amino acid racemase [bacterium]
MKNLGVIGGLGPIATAYFLELVIKMTEASCDQEHLDMIIYNYPSIPDRTSYILGKSEKNPLDKMVEVGIKLHNENVNYIAIPCITAHYFYEELQKQVQTPVINMVKETAKYLKHHNVQRVGIMATDGTIQSKLFQKEIEELGMEAIIPSKEKQLLVMDVIYNEVKANKPVDMSKFESVKEFLQKNGAQVIILGCTELSLIKRDNIVGPGFIDAMEVLAMRSVSLCELPVKHEFDNLITV